MNVRRQIVTTFAALLVATPLFAQSAAPTVTEPIAAPTTTQSVAAQAPSTGPLMRGTTAGVQSSAALAVTTDAPAVPQVSRSKALMVVGVATLIVGAVVGGQEGTIVMIVGGVMGLVGLWNYIQ